MEYLGYSGGLEQPWFFFLHQQCAHGITVTSNDGGRSRTDKTNGDYNGDINGIAISIGCITNGSIIWVIDGT